MPKTSGINFKHFFGYLPLLCAAIFSVLAIIDSPWFGVASVILYIWGMWAPLGALCVLGPIYWITRKDHRNFSIGLGTMHQTYYPWRKGRGIYIVVLKRCFQIGLSQKQLSLEEADGILSAVQGRYLDLTPNEIGEWNAVQKGTKDGAPTS